jgi:glycosyltransferase involved in cell wall biosynthesis
MARIMHVITGLHTGGAEMMLWKLLSLSHAHHSQAVVSLMDEGTIGARIAGLNVPVYSLGLRAAAPSPVRALSIRSLTHLFNPDLILGWMYHGNLMASFAGLVSPGKPPVLWGIRHALDDLALRRRPVVKLGAFFSRQPAAIIYNSAIGAQQHAAFGFHTAQQVVIPNGFDCQSFHPDPASRREVRKELALEEDATLIGLVARYHPMKDHAGFLRAAALVAREHPSARFALIGRGTREQPALQALVAEFGLEDRVFLLGERPDMPRITAALDIACSGSAWGEGFSNAIGEAMACGVPCVVTEVGDSPYLVGQTGLCVPPSQPEALARAICQLISAGPEYRQQLGAAARRRVEDNFSLPAVVCRFEKVFEEHLPPHSHNGA